jgi:hypothetical protein
MVMIPQAHEIADKIYEHFNGKCVLTWEIVQYVKRLGYKAPSRTTLVALRYLAANGKMHMYKIYKDYAIYCFGREYKDENLFDHKEIRKCIEQHLPVFNVADIIECATGRKAEGRNIILHLDTLFELMRMIRERKIRYFVVTTDAKNRLRILVDRQITAEDLQRKA